MIRMLNRAAAHIAITGMLLLTSPFARAEQAQSSPQITAPPADPARAPESKPVPTASPKQIASWKAALMGRLNSLKHYPGNGSGTSTVAFTIDRAGRVFSASLITSSGNAALDREVLALVRRASPLPAPPAGVGNPDSIRFTMPIRFAQPH